MKLLKNGWLLHCNTGSLRRYEASVSCFISLSNNYETVKACSKNITCSINQGSQSTNSCQAFLSKSSFIPCQKKSAKCPYFATGRCFIHPSLIFATQSLVMSLQHIQLCISLVSQSLGTLCVAYVMKDPLLL